MQMALQFLFLHHGQSEAAQAAVLLQPGQDVGGLLISEREVAQLETPAEVVQ